MNSEYEKIVHAFDKLGGTLCLQDMCFELIFCHYHDEYNKPESNYHSHSFFEIHIMLDGKCLQNSKVDNYTTYEKDEFWIIYPNIVHSRTKVLQSTYREITIAFNLYKMENGVKKNVFPPLKKDEFSRGYITYKIADLINKIISNALHENDFTHNKLFMLFNILALEFFELVDERNNEMLPQTTDVFDDKVQNICLFISDNLQYKLTADDISETFGLSTRQLDRIFQSKFKTTLSQYIKLQKYIYSKKLLEITNLSIENIAFRIGFDQTFSFSRFFASFYGSTPSDYRKMYKKNTADDSFYSVTSSSKQNSKDPPKGTS